MVRSVGSAMTAPWYYDCMEPLDLQLNTIFATSFPNQYKDYKSVSASGREMYLQILLKTIEQEQQCYNDVDM